jgi:hypothetical protein
MPLSRVRRGEVMPLMCDECKCSNWYCDTCGESNHHDCDCTCCGCECQKENSDNSDNSEADSVALILDKETALLLADSLRIAINNYDFDGDYETSEKVEKILKQVQP